MGVTPPLAKATTVMVWVPGVEGAVNVYENVVTPRLAKLVKRCTAACERVTGSARVGRCANDVAVEPLMGTGGVMPMKEPSTWGTTASAWRQLLVIQSAAACCNLQSSKLLRFHAAESNSTRQCLCRKACRHRCLPACTIHASIHHCTHACMHLQRAYQNFDFSCGKNAIAGCCIATDGGSTSGGDWVWEDGYLQGHSARRRACWGHHGGYDRS